MEKTGTIDIPPRLRMRSRPRDRVVYINRFENSDGDSEFHAFSTREAAESWIVDFAASLQPEGAPLPPSFAAALEMLHAAEIYFDCVRCEVED
jgi:hypothetical protein